MPRNPVHYTKVRCAVCGQELKLKTQSLVKGGRPYVENTYVNKNEQRINVCPSCGAGLASYGAYTDETKY